MVVDSPLKTITARLSQKKTNIQIQFIYYSSFINPPPHSLLSDMSQTPLNSPTYTLFCFVLVQLGDILKDLCNAILPHVFNVLLYTLKNPSVFHVHMLKDKNKQTNKKRKKKKHWREWPCIYIYTISFKKNKQLKEENRIFHSEISWRVCVGFYMSKFLTCCNQQQRSACS